VGSRAGFPQLENTSDSVTEWVDASGTLREQWTEPNSVLALRAVGALHQVLPVKRGERSIVKARLLL
jgi:hypothetical protein